MAEQTFGKEVSNWHSDIDDFRGDSELMVTITLHEYRDLLKTKATLDYQLKKKDEEIYDMRTERDEANQRVQSLLSTLNGENEEADNG